ncbi:tyrosine-protein kinase RYK-like [Pecten maximus]|uniref:tyrosine-protein kinase RYK-like n=1 Tax=Pecten maximus TaxID=6579 RepID=UPI001458FF1D|nr:tyrosine-protein kinase RYK-like [Pecten maximus]
MSSRCFYLGCIVVFGLMTCPAAYFNMYLDSAETFRLLGINAELYYVRNGIINDYALSFELLIQPNIDKIYFTWQSIRQQIMFYSLKTNTSNPRAMLAPVANISSEGKVPTTLSVFHVKVPCTGRLNREVHFLIQMEVSIFSVVNKTLINIRRKKNCQIDSSMSRPFLHDQPLGGVYPFTSLPPTKNTTVHQVSPPEPAGAHTMSTHIFYIAVGCACAVILLIALAVAVYYLNTQKNNNRGYTDRIKYYDNTSSSQALTKQQSQSFLRVETPVDSSIKGSVRNCSVLGPSPIPELSPPDPKEILTEIAISRKRISLAEMLLEGTFGKVYQGTLLSEGDNNFGADQEIIVKTVTDQARSDQVHLFLTESCMMKGLVHQNIYPVIGACVEDQLCPYVIYPNTTEGNLKKFLQKCGVSDTGSHCTLSTQQLVYLAIQIVRGIQFLHRQKILHKDIATRNCVIDNDLVLKITDNALSRDLFSGDYNCLGDNENRPIKWLSIEALLEKRFSTASDVWSFGVTLWELMTVGQQPYADIDPFEMAAYLREGYRIAQPINCPDELFSVMACCWAGTPEERPKFSQLLICLQDFYTALGQYI